MTPADRKRMQQLQGWLRAAALAVQALASSAWVWLAGFWFGGALLAVRGAQLIAGQGPALLVAAGFMVITAALILRGMQRA